VNYINYIIHEMRILVVSQYFWPEVFRINDLLIELTKKGNDVSVLTGNPNYPYGNFFKGYGFNFRIEFYEGIKIYRVPILPRGKNNFTLALNYLSFVLSGSLFAIFHRKKYDRIIAANYSPITAAYPAIVFKKRHKLKLILWVQDLWPESIRAASNIKSGFVDKLLLSIVKNIYKNSDHIVVSNSGFTESIIQKGVSEKKISFIPNWAEDLYEDENLIDDSKFRILIPEGFIVMFAGNIGEAQDFDSIVKAATLTKHFENIKWIIIGDGRKREWLKKEIESQKLSSTFFLIDRYPMEEMPNFFVHADVALATLKNEYIFSLTIPAKVQSYMAFGVPIVTMLTGAGNRIINEAKCGLTSESSDYNKLAENIIYASSLSKIELSEMGNNGKEYYQKNFAKKIVIESFNKILNQE
jgi:glycosyltransferase involved in cell wall biosynthesis